MRSHLGQRVLNVVLRIAAMGSRFALTLVLAKLLAPSELGMLGLLLAAISFSALLIGGDYYIYCLRELLSSPRERWSFVLQHQMLATLVLYALFLPLLTLLFVFGLLPTSLMGWFFVLLLIDHMVSEINRILVAMHRPLLASWMIFIRMGAWVWGVLFVMWVLPASRNVETVFIGWLIGGLFAIWIGVHGVSREASPWRRWGWDKAWLLRGFRVGLMFLVATLCFKALTSIDRFVVEALNNLDLVGVYVLYISLAGAIMGILDASVFSFLYPRLVRAQRFGDQVTYLRIRREMTWSTVVVSIGLAIAVALVMPLLLAWLEKPLYADHQPVLWLLLLTSVIYSIGMIPHYCLYARGADRSIFNAHVSSLLVFAVVTASLAASFPFEATAIGLLAAFAWLGGVKLIQYRECLKLEPPLHDRPITSVAAIGQ